MYRRTFGLMMLTFALGACESTPSISSDTTPGASFAKYGTYMWVDMRGSADVSPVAFERMRQGVERALAQKGFTKGSPGDLSLILSVGGKEKTDISQWGYYGQQLSVYSYTEGKLTLDVFDTKTRQALWHGEAKQVVDPGRVEPSVIDAAVAGVMAQFPSRG